MTEFQIFAKPVGSTCNLRCEYCYYLTRKNLYPHTRKFLMSDEILEEYIRQHIQASSEETIFFSWHGGEPLLAGLEFYRKVVSFQKKHRIAGSEIVNGIQTNGTLINKEWCRFFASEKFMIGISLDGPHELHNLFRKSPRYNKTFFKVLMGYELLVEHGITPEILCVVNDINVKYPLEVYDFFKGLKPAFLTFIPLVEPDSTSPSAVSNKSVKALEFGYFLSKIFDSWVENDIGKIKIQIIEEALRIAFNQEHTLCIFKKECGAVPVVEHNGDFYSCDHYVNKDHFLGNIMDHSLAYFLENTRQISFGRDKLLSLPIYCTECEVRSMCNGECPRNRLITTPDGEPGLNYLCAGYKYFFNHCRPFVEAVAEAWRNQ